MISDTAMILYMRHFHGFKYPVKWYAENASRLHAMYREATKLDRAHREAAALQQLKDERTQEAACLSGKLIKLFGTDKMSEMSTYQRKMIWEMKKKGLL